ncbi:MAG TPA: FUN14 domain-containing protein, partial [Nitrososphaeraceae archaeon]
SLGIGGLATSIGIGGFLGFLMGYAIKKILKIIMIAAGFLVGITYYLQYNGVIALNWAKMEETMSNLMTHMNGFNLNTPFFPGISDQFIHAISASGIPLTGGFAAGFAFGISKG